MTYEQRMEVGGLTYEPQPGKCWVCGEPAHWASFYWYDYVCGAICDWAAWEAMRLHDTPWRAWK